MVTTRHLLLFSTALLLSAGCGEEEPAVQDTGEDEFEGHTGFCSQITEANQTTLEDGGATGANGALFVQIITDEDEDVWNPNYVANVTYVLENLDVGGSPRFGESDLAGTIAATLGEGNWNLQISNTRVAGVDCYNTLDFEIVAGQTTNICLDVACE